MIDKYESYKKQIASKFVTSFDQAFDTLSLKNKTFTLKYISSFYRKWYYSTLLTDTVLSPANLVAMMTKADSVSADMYIEINPVEKKHIKPLKITFKNLTYTLDDHHVVRDLKIITDMFDPDFELTSNDNFNDATLAKVMKKLSLYDPFYVDYLLLLGSELDLIKKLPSIYSNKAQKTSECDEFFSKSPREAFTLIVNKTIELTAFFLQGVLPVNDIFFTPDYIYSLLTDPADADEIFQSFCSFYGFEYSADMFSDTPNDNEYAKFLSSPIFILGMMLDKYFHTVFGYYLKLIRPLYTQKIDLVIELQYLLDADCIEDGMNNALFSPCYYYFPTLLGSQFFGIENFDDNLAPPKNMPVELAVTLALNDLDHFNSKGMELLYKYMIEKQSQSDIIYEIKVKVIDDKVLWKNIEMHSNSTLIELYLEICSSMGFEQTGYFSFFTDMTESPFSEYASHPKSKRKKCVLDTTLDGLNLTEKQRFMLILNDCFYPFTYVDNVDSDEDTIKDIKLELELMKIKPRKHNKIYPRVSRSSQAFVEMDYEENENYDGYDI